MCLAAAVLTGLAALQVIEAGLRSGLEAELTREFQRAEAAFEAWRSQEVDHLTQLAGDPRLERAFARGDGANDAIRNVLALQLGDEREALGLALFRGRSMHPDASVAAEGWLPDTWADAVDARQYALDKPEIARIDGNLVVLVPVPVMGGAERGTLVGAMNPRSAFASLGRTSRARVAVLDEEEQLIAGTQSAADLAVTEGFASARDGDGAGFLVLRRNLTGTPWRVAIALPEAGAPAGAVNTIVVASVFIALLAGGVAFAIGERRMQPLDELAEGARRLASGASGVRVEVPRAYGEVQMLAQSFNEMAGQLDSQRRALEQRNQELLRANEVLEQLSITDGLTHLHNHRHFHDQFAREVKRADRSGHPLCLMLIDVDDFKLLNDTYGHAAGDIVLAAAAQLMNAQVRETDYLARYGGEEFALLLPQTRLDGAVALAEKIRSVLSEHRFALQETEEYVRVTVSIGVAQHTTTADETFDAADRALYEAKGTGKDCVVAAEPQALSSPSPRRRR